MAVIALPNLEPQGSTVTDEWELRSITARSQSPLNGVATTLERVGAHWAVTLRFHNLRTTSRAIMQQFLANCRGHGSRFYVPYYGWTRRGSFSASELLSNNHFASGTTGWSALSTAALSATDGSLRISRAVSDGVSGTGGYNTSAISLTQGVPYAFRALAIRGRESAAALPTAFIGTSAGAVTDGGFASSASYGLLTAGVIPRATNNYYAGLGDGLLTGSLSGDYLECPYMSLARCALVDNGPNLLLRSDEFDHAYWTKSETTINANSATVSPLGTAIADEIRETVANAAHYVESTSVTVSSSVAEYAYSVALRTGVGRTWAALNLREETGSTSIVAFFDISNGVVGTTSTGANWSNLRTFVRSVGGGWFVVTIVGRKTNAATQVKAFVNVASADNTATYAGNTSNYILAWRATLAQSSVPTRLVLTTSAASSGTSQTGGGLHLKGLPASTAGLLLSGDPAEVMTSASTQFVRARAPLSSDASGLGYFEFEAPIRVSPIDSAAVIIQRPLCRMMLDSNTVRWAEHSGGFCDLEFTAVEDTYP